MSELERQHRLALAKPESARSRYERAVLQLADKLTRFGTLVESYRTPAISTEREKLLPSLQEVQATIA